MVGRDNIFFIGMGFTFSLNILFLFENGKPVNFLKVKSSMDAEVEDYYKFYSLECGLNQRRYYNPGDKSILVSYSKNGYYPSGHP